MNKTALCGLCLISSSVIYGATYLNEKPNVIMIMADDMGWGDVGFNGNTIIKTPHLDALASEGVIMERFYSAAPLSSPTRVSVLTGRHPFRTGVFSANIGILRQCEITLPEVLKNNGYSTGFFGKWHLGTLTYKEKDANRGRMENKHLYNPPSWHGFEESFITESKVPTFDPMIQPTENDGRFWDYIREGEAYKAYGTAYWNKDGKKETDNLQGDDSKIIMDRALAFMEQAQQKQKPFFSVIWFHAPHLPCVAGSKQVVLYKDLDKRQRNYYGCITALDEQIGRLVNCLKEKNIYDNSIILFCSDNGPELETPGSPGNFRGKKRSLYEGGIRVPSIITWPAKLNKGEHLTIPCSTEDYMPTLLDMIGIIMDSDVAWDGESFWPKLLKKEDSRKNPMVFCSGYQGAVIDMDYKLYYTKGKYELYNVIKDPSERKDISADYPDKKEKMKKILQETIEDFRQSFEQGKIKEHSDWQDWWNIWE